MSLSRLRSFWERYEIPTWILAGFIYGSWGLLVWYHTRVPLWVLFVLGAWFTAWHASLQHETIHAMVRIPRWLRIALASPPLGLGFPYLISVHEHTKHHRNPTLTDPDEDPETFYHASPQWNAYHPAIRSLYLVNQTLAGRMLIGTPLHLAKFIGRETHRILRKDYSHVPAWTLHGILLVSLLLWVGRVAGMPWWQYLLFFAYPGTCLASLRSFIEHRWDEHAARRTAIVENDFPWGVLFLYNNLHAIHHQNPALPWYKIRGVWNLQRLNVAEKKLGYYFSGYRTILSRWLVRPVFVPVHLPKDKLGYESDNAR